VWTSRRGTSHLAVLPLSSGACPDLELASAAPSCPPTPTHLMFPLAPDMQTGVRPVSLFGRPCRPARCSWSTRRALVSQLWAHGSSGWVPGYLAVCACEWASPYPRRGVWPSPVAAVLHPLAYRLSHPRLRSFCGPSLLILPSIPFPTLVSGPLPPS